MKDDEIVEEIIDEFGIISERMGFSDITGKIWATLYFKGQMTQEQLKNKLNCSLSLISQSLNILENCGMMDVSKKEGRKKMYSAEFSIAKARKALLENTLRLKIEPMNDLLQSRMGQVSDKELKNKIVGLNAEFSKSSTFIKLILKLPFCK